MRRIAFLCPREKNVLSRIRTIINGGSPGVAILEIRNNSSRYPISIRVILTIRLNAERSRLASALQHHTFISRECYCSR